MKQFNAQTTVDSGLYFNLRQLRFRSMEERGVLPGEPNESFYRVPVALLLLVGPLVGLAYLIFLPLIGLVMVGALVVRKLAEWTTDAAVAFARVSRPTWQPVMAFLSRARHGGRHADEWSDDVEKDLEDDDES